MTTEILTPPAHDRPDGNVWSYISASRLGLWLRCPLAFRSRYIDGLKTPTTPALFLGKRVHAALEIHYRHRQLGVTLPAEEIGNRIVADWDRAVAEEKPTFETSVAEERLKQQACDLVTAYLDQAPEDEPRPLAVETTLQAPLIDPETGEDLGMSLLGVVDLVMDDSDGPLVVDFKTAARKGTPAEITHELQLSCYSYLCRQVEGRKESGLEIRSLIKTKVPGIEVSRYQPRTDVHFRRLFAVVREYLDALDVGRFNYRPGWTCSTCDYRDGPCSTWRG